MNDQRNMIVAVVLSLGILMLWQIFVAEPQLAKDRKLREAQKSAQTTERSEPRGHPNDGLAGLGTISDRVLAHDEALKSGARIAIDSPILDGSLALQGARFDDLKLKNRRETIDPKSPEVEVLSPRGTQTAYYANFGWAASGAIAVPGPDTIWQSEDAGPLTPDHPVTLRWENGQGQIFIRKIAVDERYLFTVSDRVENTGTTPVSLVPYGLIARHGVVNRQTQWLLHEGLLGVFNGTLETAHYKDIAKDGRKEFSPDKTGGWLGITDKYWLVALIPEQKETFSARFVDQKVNGQDVYQTDFSGLAKTIAPGGAIDYTHHLFAGAKEVNVIDHYSDRLGVAHFDLAIDWGWFYFLTRPIFRLLDFYKHLVGNFGIAIMLLTITIKGLLFPLANRSYESMSKMQKLQPEMQRLRERYKDDNVKMQQEVMELYKKEKVNPLAGCLPIFIQIPVFFALYKVLFVTIEMRHEKFFWFIKDLSAPDPTTITNLFGLIAWTPPPAFHVLGVFPIIMGLTMFLQTKMNPKPADPMQEKIFLFMPVMFTFMMGGFPAGLVVYWTWNNLLSFLQQYVIMTRMGVRIDWAEKFPTLFGLLRSLRGKAGPGKKPTRQPGE